MMEGWPLYLSVVGGVVASVSALLYLFTRRPSLNVKGRHAIITGGSSGLGLSMAKALAAEGANVTILARNEQKLREAKIIVDGVGRHGSRVQWVSADATDEASMKKEIGQAVKEFGSPYLLCCCAGAANPMYFEKLSVDDFKAQMDTNFISCVTAAKVCFPLMKENEEVGGTRGHLMFTSSVAGLLGLFGYTAYSASKFAIRGFAEALYYEGVPHKVGVSVCFPADIDTPGYAKENEKKPEETKKMEGNIEKVTADTAAKKIWGSLKAGDFLISYGDGSLVECTASGFSPRGKVMHVALASIIRLVSTFYARSFEAMVAAK